MSDLRCRGVTAGYGERIVLREVDLVVDAGGWLALIGPNGAGKSTLLRCIAGLVGCGGSITVAGRPLLSMTRREVARRIALVPQHPVVPPGMTVADYALLGRTPHLGLLAGESKHDLVRVGEVLERLDLGELSGRPIDELSGGELQRAVLARALVQDAEVLLLDEPTSSLDLGHQQQVLELVDELRRERGLAVISALHDLTLAAQYGDRLVLLHRGSVVAEGSAADVLTVESLTDRYGAAVRVLRDPDGGVVVVPHRLRPGTGSAGVPSKPAEVIES